MASKKNFAMGKGKFYFTIKSSPNNITIFRDTFKSAADTYQKYILLGKECEWLGEWDGKKFSKAKTPSMPNA